MDHVVLEEFQPVSSTFFPCHLLSDFLQSLKHDSSLAETGPTKVASQMAGSRKMLPGLTATLWELPMLLAALLAAEALDSSGMLLFPTLSMCVIPEALPLIFAPGSRHNPSSHSSLRLLRVRLLRSFLRYVGDLLGEISA